MDESFEAMKDYRAARAIEGGLRRDSASRYYKQLRDRAWFNGMEFERHSDVHYSISVPGGWRFNIYPGNCRIYADKNKPAPYLRLPKPWTLEQAVDAATAAYRKESERRDIR